MNRTRTQTSVSLAAGLAVSASAMAQLTSYTGNEPIGFWNDATKWTAGVPDHSGAVAFVGTSVQAENSALWLQQDTTIGGLIMSDGMMLLNQGNELDVQSMAANEFTTISGSNMIGNVQRRTRLRLEPLGNGFPAGLFRGINIEDGGSFNLTANAHSINYGETNIDAQSMIEGDGRFYISGSGILLNNNGTIRPEAGEALTVQLTQASTGKLDLDGDSENGILTAMDFNSELFLIGDRTGSFEGEIKIGPASRVYFENHSGSTQRLALGATAQSLLTLAGDQGGAAMVESKEGILGMNVDIEVSGRGRILSAFETTDDTLIHIDTDGSLEMFGPTKLNGGSVDVRDNAKLDFRGNLVESASTRFDLFGGTVTGGTPNGTPIINDDQVGIRGHGLIDTGVRNDTRISAHDQKLFVIATNVNHDWDGINDDGQLLALLGDLHLYDDAAQEFRGDISVGNGHELYIEGFTMEMLGESTLQMWGGSIDSDRDQIARGKVSVYDDARIDVSFHFLSSPTIELFANLRLNGNQHIISTGSNISGDGTLINGASSDLITGQLVVVDANFNNEGVLYLGFDEALMNVKRDVMHTGYVVFELNGTNFGEYDKFVVDQTLTVRNGVFNVHLEDEYMPKYGDEFDIIDFATFVNAGYTLNLAALDPWLMWDTSDFETQGVIRVVDDPTFCYADCDQSTGAGVLDIFDFLCFQDSFVNADSYACDCNTSTGQGVCDIFDFLCFQDAFVKGCP